MSAVSLYYQPMQVVRGNIYQSSHGQPMDLSSYYQGQMVMQPMSNPHTNNEMSANFYAPQARVAQGARARPSSQQHPQEHQHQ